MRGINRIMLMGNLGADPEMRFTPTGKAVTNFRVAVNRRWRDAEGQLQERVEWFRVVCWTRLAELANQYLERGAPVYIEGRLETRSFEGNDGNVRYVSEVIASDLVLLPRGDRSPAAEEEKVEEEEGDELPF